MSTHTPPIAPPVDLARLPGMAGLVEGDPPHRRPTFGRPVLRCRAGGRNPCRSPRPVTGGCGAVAEGAVPRSAAPRLGVVDVDFLLADLAADGLLVGDGLLAQSHALDRHRFLGHYRAFLVQGD